MSASLTLLSKVLCPHCWHPFAPEETVWISEHPDLVGDPKLGFDHAKRFLPSRFTARGDAIDEMGEPATRMACPRCHLPVPRTLYQVPSLMFSILGAPACGKSYFLASMTWQLRQILPRKFGVSLNDADAEINGRIHEYEELHFMNPDPDTPVAIAKTEEQGDLYDTVDMGKHTVTLPRPFMFNLQPLASHPNFGRHQTASRVVCLYDNAGESFFPGADTTMSPVTRHLAYSKCLFFCFDPTQDPRFRQACEGRTDDPQMVRRASRLHRETSVRQDTILLEAIQRVRRHAGLRDDEIQDRPLVIIVTKWDAWESLLPGLSHDDPYVKVPGSPLCLLDRQRILTTSDAVGEMLSEICPEVVAAAQGFSTNITFIPVSATGKSPELDPESGALGIRPRDMAPYWVEVPMMMALANWAGSLISAAETRPPNS
ncbi:hypothetical protein [Stieleria varia]|uniref:Uncharacterized protein n=1 Tax=Stieleria varia TaxID=2528005 RepID=A0A5C6B4F3_9BACT|nr:hypothetical protein [Stieleria varia]TWU06442.1 hypothetical protein Pla52n_21630 [Stieleria varia]